MNIRISIINYANTIPFVYGLKESKYISKNSEFYYHYPSQGVKGLQNNSVDISIIPVAAIPSITEGHIISDFCIGAENQVDSVLLCSHVPLPAITHIRLDYQSQSSNALVQVLARDEWNITPEFMRGEPFYDSNSTDQAKVIIGDRAFSESSNYKYVYDLAHEWTKAFKLPFVFACWVANKNIPEEYLLEFNKALLYGVQNIKASIAASHQTYKFDVEDYLTNKISYNLTPERKQAQALFIEKCRGIL